MACALRIAHLAALVLTAGGAGAATFVVDRHDDVASARGCLAAVPNDCSLRGAVLEANSTAGFDTVRLAAGQYLLTIYGPGEELGLSGDLDLRDDVFLEGVGAGVTIVEAEVNDRVVDVRAGVAFLRRLSIEGGSDLDGGGGAGIRNLGAATILQRCQVAGNHALGSGGGILTAFGAGLWLQETLVWLNTAQQGGGGIRVLAGGSGLTIEDSSVVANSTAAGASELEISETTGVVRNSTISSPFGGSDTVAATDSTLTFDSSTLLVPSPARAVVLDDSTATLRNTLVAGSCAVAGAGSITTEGGNLESPGATCGLGASDLESVADPKLALLDRYGGATPTHRLLSNSPAIDYAPADAHCQARDQRGIARPQDAGAPGDPHCDIGAVERVPNELFLDGFEGGTWWGWSGWSD